MSFEPGALAPRRPRRGAEARRQRAAQRDEHALRRRLGGERLRNEPTRRRRPVFGSRRSRATRRSPRRSHSARSRNATTRSLPPPSPRTTPGRQREGAAWRTARRRDTSPTRSRGAASCPRPRARGRARRGARPPATARRRVRVGEHTANSSPPSRPASTPSRGRPDQLADLGQHPVAALVAATIVDRLEVVAVEHEEAERSALGCGSCELRSSSSPKPRRLSSPVSSSVTAVRRSRTSESAASIEDAACAASSAAASAWRRGKESVPPSRADEHADLDPVHAKRQPDDVLAAPASNRARPAASTRSNTDDWSTMRAEPGDEVGGDGGVSPSGTHAAAPPARGHLATITAAGRARGGARASDGEVGDRARVTQRAHVDEERASDERSSAGESRSSAAAAGESESAPAQQSPHRQRRGGLDVERADDVPPDGRDDELGDDARVRPRRSPGRPRHPGRTASAARSARARSRRDRAATRPAASCSRGARSPRACRGRAGTPTRRPVATRARAGRASRRSPRPDLP